MHKKIEEKKRLNVVPFFLKDERGVTIFTNWLKETLLRNRMLNNNAWEDRTSLTNNRDVFN